MTDLDLEREAITLFEAMLDIPETARDAWIADHAAGRSRLLARLTAMRAADAHAHLHTGAGAEALDEEPPPERIGAYRITGLVGRGGMGAVYRGERDVGDFAHVVAIKIIKQGLLTDRLVARFRSERQTLAQLSHPNIAQLYDGGETEAGAPYIIMEFVEGVPLLQWDSEQHPTVPERRRLFGEICAAVAFAHRNLVVHRDVTPSNVLVTRDGHAKLIDFGIAKPADAAPDRTEGTSSIASLSLTPGYAAPERMASSQVTTAADIYSLGRLLEKLIPDGADRELLAIVARATASDPLDRYPTVESLGDDVAAWGDGLPVDAVAGGKRYRAVKVFRRHRVAIMGATTALTLLIAALILTIQAYGRADAARRAEAARFADLRSLANYALFELNGELARVVGNTRARASLADRAQGYLSSLAASPLADKAVKIEAARGLTALARTQGVPTQPNLGEPVRARRNLDRALALLRANAVAGADLADALSAQAMIQAHVDVDLKQAAVTVRQAETALARVPPDAHDARWHAARRLVRYAELELATLDQAPDGLALQTRHLADDIVARPAALRVTREAALDRAYIAYFRGLHGYFTVDLDAAVGASRQAEVMFGALERSRPNDPATLYAMMWNAYVGNASAQGVPGQEVEARRFLASAIRTSDRLVQLEAHDRSLQSFAGALRQARAQALTASGDHRAAVAMQRTVIALYQDALGAERKATSLSRLAMAQVTMGKTARAAHDRPLACASYREAMKHIDELQRRGNLIGSLGGYRSRLVGNIALCSRGTPLSAMAGLD